jgi:hypothetical protein
MDKPKRTSARPQPPRRDGWTADRQLRFLTVLTHTRSVSLAVAAAGKSRESAYRLRARNPHGLFAYMWEKAMQPLCHPRGGEVDQGHKAVSFLVRATEENRPLKTAATPSASSTCVAYVPAESVAPTRQCEEPEATRQSRSRAGLPISAGLLRMRSQ